MIVHNCNYGAGARKIHQSLNLQGADITLEQCYTLHKAFWKLYSGIKRFESFLLEQWEATGGWFINSIGRPMGINQNRIKDIVNTNTQGAGHDILVIILYFFRLELAKLDAPWVPVIWDFHDECMIECNKEDVPKVEAILENVFKKLNQLLNGTVTIKYSVAICNNWADAKLED